MKIQNAVILVTDMPIYGDADDFLDFSGNTICRVSELPVDLVRSLREFLGSSWPLSAAQSVQRERAAAE